MAEGVETDEQRGALPSRGCRVMQGFLFERPVPALQLERLLRGAESPRLPSLAVAG